MPNKSKHGFDVKNAGKKPIDKRGNPVARETGVPGAPNIGTPGWLSAPVKAAEGKKSFDNADHRRRDCQVGTGSIRSGLFGRTEKIHGGQATRVGKDSD